MSSLECELRQSKPSQLFRRQRDTALAHLTFLTPEALTDEVAMHPSGHALLGAP